jgi:D-alanyl-D-alanine carboxypeptidase/D-alanyl-D-alanine-endopeptidase (penicillin-binding protein 4)
MTRHARRRGARSARRRLFATCVALLAISACRGPRPKIVPPTPTAARLTQLRHAIDAALDEAAFARGTWGVAVKSLTVGDTLYMRNAGKLMTPASTMKVVTLAAAAERLGWDYEYVTDAVLLGPLENGALKGDLLITGAGDPTIEGWEGAQSFDEWIASLTASGLRRVDGRVIGDDNAFEDEGLGRGWMWDDLASSYSAPVSALQFNQNSVQIFVTPGATPGATPMVEVVPSWAPVTIRNLLTTTASSEPVPLNVRPAGRSAMVVLAGSVPAGSPRQRRTIAVSNPTLYFAAAVRDALLRHGVEVVGEAADADDVDPPPDRQRATTLGSYRTPLRSVARSMMKQSPNLHAESLLKTLGARVSGEGSADAGRATVAKLLEEWGVARDEVVTADGSGLSRYNLVTPNAMVAVLARVFANDGLREPFLDALPIAGVDGTLAERMKGTAAQGNLRAKTGSLSNARAIAGYVAGRNGEPLAFCIIANNYNLDATAIDAATDAVLVALAQFSR